MAANRKPSPKSAPTLPDGLRVRNVGVQRIRLADIDDNPHNPRAASDEQAAALNAAVDEIGFFGYPDVFPHPATAGRWMLVDGELRTSQLVARYGADAAIDVNVTDFDATEADKAIATKDPIGRMKVEDAKASSELLAGIKAENQQFASLIDRFAAEAAPPAVTDAGTMAGDATPTEGGKGSRRLRPSATLVCNIGGFVYAVPGDRVNHESVLNAAVDLMENGSPEEKTDVAVLLAETFMGWIDEWRR